MDTYEKKYNDAMARLELVVQTGMKLDPAYIFPELREDEDERITRAINNMLPFIPDEAYANNGVTKEDVLNYLEKQKENAKSCDSIPADCTSDAKCEDKSPKHSDSDGTDIRDTPAYWKGWDDAMKQKEQKHPNGCFTCDEYKKGYEAGRLNGFTAGYNKAMKEVDQKEQKPAEWDEYTKTNLDRALQIIKKAKGTLQGYQSDDGIYECDKAIECLEHFLYRGLEIEKPAEWSDTDNIGWDEAFACVTRAEEAAKNEEELQNAVTAEKWLKEIKFKYYVHPVKQELNEKELLNRTYEEGFNDGLKYRKPVKRSDEDKKMSDWLIGLVNANTELSFKDKVNLTRWLEHLTIEKELSKNDKRIMDAIMIGYQDKDFRSSQIPTPIGVSKDEVIAWLKSLPERFNPQPKNEWSEEDEDAINGAIGILLDDNNPTFVFPEHSKLSVGEIVKRLESLRPQGSKDSLQTHWKPSEEQMKALRLARSFVVDDFSEKPTLSETLKDLEEQLKKLT